MNDIVKSGLIMLCVWVPFDTYAVSFTADAVQLRGTELSHARMFWHEGSRIRGIQWYDAELNVVVRQRAENGAIDELRNIRIEEIRPELFAIPEGYAAVESQLSDLDSESAPGFGATDN